MDPQVQAVVIPTVITAAAAVTVAWIGRPARKTNRRLSAIEGEFRNNGGSTMRDLLETQHQEAMTAIDGVERQVDRLTGRFEQHVSEARIPQSRRAL